MIVCSTDLFNLIKGSWRYQNILSGHFFYCENIDGTNKWYNYENQGNEQDQYDFNLPDIYHSNIINLGNGIKLSIHYFLKKHAHENFNNYTVEASSKFHQMTEEDFIEDFDRILHQDGSVVGNSKVGHIRNNSENSHYESFVARENKKLNDIIVRESISMEDITKTIYWKMSVESFNEIPDNMKE